MSRSLRRFLPIALLALASCSNDEIFIPEIDTTNFAASLGVDLAASIHTPSGLWYRDVTVGAGTLVPADTNKRVTVAYEGALRNGLEFDAGTFSFTTDFAPAEQNAIEGMREGVEGMRIGGERQLILPPKLGYGAVAQSGIPANSILVFTVTLLNVTAP